MISDNSTKIINFCYFLVLIFPLLLIFSNFLSELIIIILILCFLKNNFALKKLKYYLDIFGILFFIFLLILIISSFLSDYYLLTFKKSLTYIRYILFSFAICWVLSFNNKFILNLFKVLVITFFILQLGALFEYFFNINPIYGKREIDGSLIRYYEAYKISSFFGDEEIMGSYFSRLFPLIIALFLINYESLKKKFKYLTYFVFVFIIISIFFSGERLAFFFLIVFLLCSILTLRLNYKNLILITLSLIISVITIFSFDKQRERIFNYTIKQMTSENKIIFFTIQHHSHFMTAYKIFLDNKIIGAGPNTFRETCKLDKYNLNEYSCSTHPHNYFIQLLSETGIIGAVIPILIFLFVVIKFLEINLFKRNFIIKKNKKNIINLFLVFFIISLFPLTPNGNFFSNWTNMIMFFGFGIYLYYFKNLYKFEKK